MNTVVKTTTTEDLMLRALKARIAILETIKPSKYYTNIYMVFYPEDNTKEGLQHLRQVWSLHRADEEIIEKLERLPDLIKQS